MGEEIKRQVPVPSQTRLEVGFRLTKEALVVAKRINARPAQGIRFQAGQLPAPDDDVIFSSEKGKVVFKVKRHQYDIAEDQNIVISILLGLREGIDYDELE